MKSFWVKKYMGEKYVQEESLGEKVYWVKSMVQRRVSG